MMAKFWNFLFFVNPLSSKESNGSIGEDLFRPVLKIPIWWCSRRIGIQRLWKGKRWWLQVGGGGDEIHYHQPKKWTQGEGRGRCFKLKQKSSLVNGLGQKKMESLIPQALELRLLEIIPKTLIKCRDGCWKVGVEEGTSSKMNLFNLRPLVLWPNHLNGRVIVG